MCQSDAPAAVVGRFAMAAHSGEKASPRSAYRRLVQVLQLFGRMAIADFDRMVASLPIQQIDGLKRWLEQDVCLTVSTPSCSNAPFSAGCAASVITARWSRSRQSKMKMASDPTASARALSESKVGSSTA